MPRKSAALAGPVQAQMIVNAPAPVTVSAPDTAELVTTYTTEILPLATFTIETPGHYVEASALWTKARQFVAHVESLFRDAKSAAYKAHKAITTLEGQFLAPGQQIAARMQAEILRWEAEQERLRQAEEARLLELERLRLQAEHEAALALERIMQAPWDDEPVVAKVIEMQAPVPVRIASTVPLILGGPQSRNLPWQARLVSLRTLVQAAAKDDTLLVYLLFNQAAANQKARELGADLNHVIPGVEANRERTLASA